MDGHNEHNEFEHFLKQNADAHRLYPSEGVWNHIHSRLHDHRRRTVLLLILLPLLTGMGWFLHIYNQHFCNEYFSKAFFTKEYFSKEYPSRVYSSEY